jgi:hypothetical protein
LKQSREVPLPAIGIANGFEKGIIERGQISMIPSRYGWGVEVGVDHSVLSVLVLSAESVLLVYFS